ncbi:winged helix-turn-helix transcriptional regulator [Rhodococcus sp. NPDC059234]|uniref:winged helix-turn-helix transcriptional regulator n=1 Tax=Rhodococcus sp. NPDC059234 TaxID=3346781 RepID=UPI003672972C
MRTSTPGGSAAHQTVSRTQWDEELVPTPNGRTAVPDPACSVEIALHAIAGRWTTLVLRNVMHGPASFSELSNSLPALSDKVLTDRLTHLVNEGIVERGIHSGFPSRTVYRLTPRGEALRPLLIELYRTGQRLREARDRDPIDL